MTEDELNKIFKNIKHKKANDFNYKKLYKYDFKFLTK